MDDEVGFKLYESEEQLESGVESEEEEEEEEEEEDYEQLVKMTSPVAANWNDSGLVKGVVIIDDDALLLYDSKSLFNSKFKVVADADDDNRALMLTNNNNNNDNNNTKKGKRKRKDNHTCCQLFDVCPICFEPWTSSYENHQLCSLPCGHLYGSSCINKWLQKSSRSSRKCPQCNTLCALTDVRPLQATCLSISKHKKASSYSSSPTTATRHFPFRKEGYQALKDYVLQRRLVALRLARVSSNWRVEVVKRAEDAADRLYFLSRRRDELLKYQTCADGSQAGAFLQRADALKRRILPLARRAEALEQRAEALEQRASAFRHLNKAYLACIDYFTEMCKKLDLDAVLVGE